MGCVSQTIMLGWIKIPVVGVATQPAIEGTGGTTGGSSGKTEGSSVGHSKFLIQTTCLNDLEIDN